MLHKNTVWNIRLKINAFALTFIEFKIECTRVKKKYFQKNNVLHLILIKHILLCLTTRIFLYTI